jgi:hypothetical protein
LGLSVSLPKTVAHCFSIIVVLILSSRITAQQPKGTTTPGNPPEQQTPCVQPARIFVLEKYTGPFKHIVGYFVRKPEIKTVHLRRTQAGQRICALTADEKFNLFVRNTFHPVTLISAGWNAGIAQTENNDPTFGQGAEGYGKRFGTAAVDRVSSDFFHTFLFPVIFRQDPRYYRQGYGGFRERLGHALTHVFVARSDSGKSEFNYSEWLGTASAVALSNTYHPGNDRGFGPASQRVAANIATDAGFDVLREFWPEIVRKFKLPFRLEPAPNAPPASDKHH